MRRAVILLLAAALSLCLLAGANAALAPAWESADFELEALAGSQEAAAGLRLYSRVLYGDIAVIGSGLNLDLVRDISGDTELSLRIGPVEAFLPPEPEDTPPALASGQAEGGYKYYGEGWALSAQTGAPNSAFMPINALKISAHHRPGLNSHPSFPVQSFLVP